MVDSFGQLSEVRGPAFALRATARQAGSGAVALEIFIIFMGFDFLLFA